MLVRAVANFLPESYKAIERIASQIKPGNHLDPCKPRCGWRLDSAGKIRAPTRCRRTQRGGTLERDFAAGAG